MVTRGIYPRAAMLSGDFAATAGSRNRRPLPFRQQASRRAPGRRQSRGVRPASTPLPQCVPHDYNLHRYWICATHNGGSWKETDPWAEVNAIKEELSAFKNAIVNNTKPVVSEIDGLMAMDVAHQILDKIGNNIISR